MKTKILQRAICLLLTLCSIIGIFPVTAFASHEHVSESHYRSAEENCDTNNLSIDEEDSSAVMTAIPMRYLKNDNNKRSKKLAVYEKEIVTKAICAITGHEPGNWYVTEEATCLTSGKKVQSCTQCGLTMSSVTIAPLGHSMKLSGGQAATCTKAGYIIRTCARCPYDEKSEGVPATGHVSGGWYVTEEATCLTSGQKVQSCTKCGSTMSSATIAPLGHNMKPSGMQEPTCTTVGYIIRSCKRCPYDEKSEQIPATGHESGGWYVTEEATCLTSGQKVQSCTKCGSTMSSATIAPLGHNMKPSGMQEPTCTTVGYIIRSCKRCPYDEKSEQIPATGHESGGWYVTEEATCLTSGQKVQSCTKCGLTMSSATIAPLGHNMKLSGGQEATCTKAGYIIRTCTRCPYDEKSEGTPATGHACYTEEVRIEISPCEVEYRTHTKCRNCTTDFGYTPRTEVNHCPGEWKIVELATCVKSGKRAKICTKCGEEVSTVTLPVSRYHSFGATREIKKPTCTEVGYSIRYCKWCPFTAKTQVVPATGHSFCETRRIEPTCDEDGRIESFCSTCSKWIEVEELAALPHDTYTVTSREERSDCIVYYKTWTRCRKCLWKSPYCAVIKEVEHTPGEWKEIERATCLEEGKRETDCSECGLALKEIIPKTIHDHYKGWVYDGSAYYCEICNEYIYYNEAKEQVDLSALLEIHKERMNYSLRDYGAEFGTPENLTVGGEDYYMYSQTIGKENYTITWDPTINYSGEEWAVTGGYAACAVIYAYGMYCCSQASSSEEDPLLDLAEELTTEALGGLITSLLNLATNNGFDDEDMHNITENCYNISFNLEEKVDVAYKYMDEVPDEIIDPIQRVALVNRIEYTLTIQSSSDPNDAYVFPGCIKPEALEGYSDEEYSKNLCVIGNGYLMSEKDYFVQIEEVPFTAADISEWLGCDYEGGNYDILIYESVAGELDYYLP